MTDIRYSPFLYQMARGFLEILLRLYNRLEVTGREHVPRTGACIVAANHVSFLDPPIVGSAVGMKPVVRFMARDTLFKHPLGGRFLRGVAAVPISRERGDVGALRKALAVLKEGACLGLFPEGTRSPDGQLATAKGGIGFLIAKAEVPVVPCFIDGSYDAFPRHAKWIRPVKVRAFIGKPIQPIEFTSMGEGRDRYERIGALVMERIAALRPADRRLPAAPAAPPSP